MQFTRRVILQAASGVGAAAAFVALGLGAMQQVAAHGEKHTPEQLAA